MKKWTTAGAILLLLSSAASADLYNLGDFRLALIDDPFRITFQKGSAELTAAGIEKAIVTQAMLTTGPAAGWRVTGHAEGVVELTNLVQNKHLIVLEVSYDAAGYRIRLVRSENLLYREQVRDGTPVRAIHRTYNAWVRQLVNTINAGVDAPAEILVGYAPVEKVDAVPFLNQPGRDAYTAFLTQRTPRAFAIAPNGAWGHSSAYRSATRADEAEVALSNCNRFGNGECRLYAIDYKVVWGAPEGAPASKP